MPSTIRSPGLANSLYGTGCWMTVNVGYGRLLRLDGRRISTTLLRVSFWHIETRSIEQAGNKLPSLSMQMRQMPKKHCLQTKHKNKRFWVC